MAGRFGRLVGLAVGTMLVVSACASPTTIDQAGRTAGSVAGSAGATQPLRGVRLEAGIEPGGIDADRFAYADGRGAAVLSLGTGQAVRLPPPPRGLVFRPTAISGNLVIGEVSGLDLDPLLVEAMGYDLASGSWLDVAGALPAGHSSSAVATDGATIVGQDLGAPGSRQPVAAYSFDVASGAASLLPNLAGGVVPAPTAVGGGVIVGDVRPASGSGRGGGWTWDQAGQQYTLLATVGGSDRAAPLAVAGGTVVGVVSGATAAADSPFVYDLATRSFTDLHLPGAAAADVSGHLVLLAMEAGWNGSLRNLDTGGSMSFGAVIVDGSPTGVRPWEISGDWVVALAPSAGSSASGVVAIDVGAQP